MNDYHRIAATILKAAEIRESSWNGRIYTKPLWTSICNATDVMELRDIVSLMMSGTWNESLEWAEAHKPPPRKRRQYKVV